MRDVHKERSLPQPVQVTDKVEDILNDPEIDIVIEVMGGRRAC